MRLPRNGDKVSMKNPTTGESAQGKILDQAWVYEPEEFDEIAPASESGWLEPAFVAQLIEWDSGEQTVRFAYYTRRPGQSQSGWKFAQFAPIMSIEDTSTLLSKIRQKGWLRKTDKSAIQI